MIVANHEKFNNPAIKYDAMALSQQAVQTFFERYLIPTDLMSTPSRNDPCPCGSGKKYKNCCIGKTTESHNFVIQTGKLAYPAVSLAGTTVPAALLSKAITLLQASRLDEAIAGLRKIISANPDNAEAYSMLGQALQQQGQLEEAIINYQRALALKPGNIEVLNNMGGALYMMGKYDEAIACLRTGLALRPHWAEAHNNLGILLVEQSKPDEAVACFRRALSIKPDYAEAYNNLGNTFKDQGKLDEAAGHYRKALVIRPEYAEAFSNLGNTLVDQGKLDEAAIYYREALKLKPNSAEIYGNLGAVCRDRGKLDEAVIYYRDVLKLKPDSAETYGNLGGVFLRQGKLQDALECFRHQVSLDPENSTAQHLIASLTGRTSERAPAQYVERLFDSCADKFDNHLLQLLKYETPEKLVSLIAQHSAAPAEKWDILDLGCGTGLVGISIAPFVRQLVGVDLSARMLEQAGARNLYSRLEHLDLLTMMQQERTASYDLIIAADVFVYLGKLDEIVSETKRLLCAGGLFAFTVESLEAALTEGAGPMEYQLGLTGRYMHAASYITRLAAANGYLIVELTETQVRLDQGKPVIGYIALLKSQEPLMRPAQLRIVQ